MASKIFCDRCGKEIGVTYADSAIVNYRRNEIGFDCARTLDLCVECYFELLDWIKERGSKIDRA